METTKRKKKEKTETGKLLKQIREKLTTSIVEFELITTGSHQKVILSSMEHARMIRNNVLGKVWNNYKQMKRTRRYKTLYTKYVDVLKQCNNITDKTKKERTEKLKEDKKVCEIELECMREEFQVTFDFARKEEVKVRKKFDKAQSVVGLVMIERVWQSMESIIFGNGEKPKFVDDNHFYSIQGKQNERCIMFKKEKDTKNKKGRFHIYYRGQSMYIKVKQDDIFAQETLSHIEYYMKHGSIIDEQNIKNIQLGKELIPTYRVKYNRIIRKKIRGKYRFFVQLALEGPPVPKRNKDWSFRHILGTGIVASDIGTQSVAIVTKDAVILKNLADRTNKKRERKITLLQNKLNRSRKEMNPNCFNEKGVPIKKMKVQSKTYQKTKSQLNNLHRMMAENRKYAHNEDANILRSLGNTFITENNPIKAWQKRAKETTVNEKTGKMNRKKRAGKSILNRSPGYFTSQNQYRFEMTDGTFELVNTWTFKASQYDHKMGRTNPKQLSQRWHIFEDGTKVQRDLYSAFLLYCSNEERAVPDQTLCNIHFEWFKKLHDACIEQIITEGKDIKNSGIKVSKVVVKKKNSFTEKKKDAWFSKMNKTKRKQKRNMLKTA